MRGFLLIGALFSAMATSQGDSPRIPVKTKESPEGVSTFEAKWYSESLKRADEQPLSNLAKGQRIEIYRLQILPTWGNPIIVRVQKKDSTYALVASRLSGQGGYDPGEVAERKEVQLSTTDSQEFTSLLDALRFFEMPTQEDFRGFDGDETVFEGAVGGKYHVVTRWCATAYDPKKRGLLAFNALTKFLIDKSQLSERPKNKAHRLL